MWHAAKDHLKINEGEGKEDMSLSTSGLSHRPFTAASPVRIRLGIPAQGTDHPCNPRTGRSATIDWKEDRGCAYRQVDNDRMDREVVKVRVILLHTTAKTAWVPARPSNKAPLIHWDNSNFL